jgi:hypothetical protein
VIAVKQPVSNLSVSTLRHRPHIFLVAGRLAGYGGSYSTASTQGELPCKKGSRETKLENSMVCTRSRLSSLLPTEKRLRKKYNGLTETVKSPQQRGQSTGYPPNLHCDYRIKTPQGYKIHARFNNFTLKWSPGCVSDYVKLSHDKKKWSQPYCGIVSNRKLKHVATGCFSGLCLMELEMQKNIT